jgi:surface protein
MFSGSTAFNAARRAKAAVAAVDPTSLMIINIRTTAADKSREFPFDNRASLSLDWGDNKFSKTTTHTYGAADSYQIRIAGKATRYGKQDGYLGASLITSVSQWGTLGLESLRGAFFGAANLTSVPSDIPQSVTDMSGMFQQATEFNQDILLWNTENVTDMSSMFQQASKFNQLLLWNTEKVTNASSMFENATDWKKAGRSIDLYSKLEVEEKEIINNARRKINEVVATTKKAEAAAKKLNAIKQEIETANMYRDILEKELGILLEQYNKGVSSSSAATTPMTSKSMVSEASH